MRRGGTLLISDGSNGANWRVRDVTEEIWERWERGPEGAIGDHDVREPFVERRGRLIRERFPDLDAAAVARYAANTAGFERAQIVAAVQAHRGGGPAPQACYQRGMLARDHSTDREAGSSTRCASSRIASRPSRCWQPATWAC